MVDNLRFNSILFKIFGLFSPIKADLIKNYAVLDKIASIATYDRKQCATMPIDYDGNEQNNNEYDPTNSVI